MNNNVAAAAAGATNGPPSTPARASIPVPQKTACVTCRMNREEKQRNFTLYQSLNKREKDLKEREESVGAEVFLLRAEIEELKQRGSTAGPTAVATGKKRKAENDTVTLGSPDNDKRLEAEIKRLQAAKEEWMSKYDTINGKLQAAETRLNITEFGAKLERDKILGELELKLREELKVKGHTSMGGHGGHEEKELMDELIAKQKEVNDAKSRLHLVSKEANTMIINLQKQVSMATEEINVQKNLVHEARKNINSMEQRASSQCRIEYEHWLEQGRQQVLAQMEHDRGIMNQQNNDTQVKVGEYQARIAEYERKVPGYESTIAQYKVYVPQIEGRMATAESQASSLTNDLRTEKTQREAAERLITSLMEEVKEHKSHKETTENEASILKGEASSLKDQVIDLNNQLTGFKDQITGLNDQLNNLKDEVSTLQDDVHTEKTKKEAVENRANNLQTDLNTANAATERENRERKHDLDVLAEVLRASPTMPAMKKSIQNMEDRARNANGVMPTEMAKCAELLGCRANLPDIRREIQVIVDELKAVDGDRAADVTALSNILGTKSKKMKYIRNDVQALVDERKTTEVLRGEFKTLAGILKCNPRMSDMRRAIRNLVQESSERKARTGIDVAVAALAQQLGTESVSMTQIRKDITKLMQHNEEAVRERDSLRIKQSTLQNEISKSAWSLKKIETREREKDMVEDHLKIANDRIDWLEAEYKVGQPPAVEKIVKQGKIASKQLGQFEGLLWFLGGLYLFGSCVCALAGAV
ncbi:uncharacterized protein PAC_17047 [Phialocephala subalpina]|uniref:Uncharacterized protein n=1 Tax=Phialocephala subalpina TaxID=576137 RepID=A0A1L7XQB1_9HELO|nr:uncharacterized protein PAC_17047 [Phialocephala subalpina]